MGVEEAHQRGQLMQAQRLDNGPAADVRRYPEERGEGAVGKLDAPTLVQQKQPLDHAVKENFLLGLNLQCGPLLILLQGIEFTLGRLAQAQESRPPPEMQARQCCERNRRQHGPEHDR